MTPTHRGNRTSSTRTKNNNAANAKDAKNATIPIGAQRAEWEDAAEDLITEHEWNEKDFLVAAQDTKGHSERQWFRCQPGYDRDMDMLVASKHFPFKTKGDFIRWAIWAGLRVLEKLEPDRPTVTRQVELTLTLVREDEFRAEMDDLFKRVGDRVTAHMTEGDESGDVKELLARTRAALDGMPQGPWRERYEERYRKQFAAYLKKQKEAKGKSVIFGGKKKDLPAIVKEPETEETENDEFEEDDE